jgi:hypothetical protein
MGGDFSKMTDSELAAISHFSEDDVKKLEEEIEKLEDQAQEFPIQTLEDEMKVELLQVLFNKYSLRELEEKLGGNKFTL